MFNHLTEAMSATADAERAHSNVKNRETGEAAIELHSIAKAKWEQIKQYNAPKGPVAPLQEHMFACFMVDAHEYQVDNLTAWIKEGCTM